MAIGNSTPETGGEHRCDVATDTGGRRWRRPTHDGGARNWGSDIRDSMAQETAHATGNGTRDRAFRSTGCLPARAPVDGGYALALVGDVFHIGRTTRRPGPRSGRSDGRFAQRLDETARRTARGVGGPRQRPTRGRCRLACPPQSSMLRVVWVAGRSTFAVAGLFRPLSGRPDRARGEAPVSVPTPSFVSAPYFATRYS